MQVLMLADVFAADATLLARGSTQDLADAVALDLIGTGRAQWVSAPVATPTPIPGVVTVTPAQLAASATPVPAGTLLRDPYSGMLWAQSDGAGGALQILGYVYAGPWSARPAAYLYPGRQAFITDVGACGCAVRSDGMRWQATGPVLLPGVHSETQNTAANTLPWIFWAYTFPIGFFGPTGRVVIRPVISYTADTDDRTVSLKVSGAADWTTTVTDLVTGDAPWIEVIATGESSLLRQPYGTVNTFERSRTTAFGITTEIVDLETETLAFVFEETRANTTVSSTTVYSLAATYYPI